MTLTLLSTIPHKVLHGQAQTTTASNHNEEPMGFQEGQSSTSLISCMAMATANKDFEIDDEYPQHSNKLI
jgi:hypothetical protein